MNDLIMKAAQYMDEHGKCRKRYQDPEGRVCMVGALRMVACGTANFEIGVIGGDPEYREAWRHLTAYTRGRLLSKGGFSVPAANDHVLKTQAETVKFMMEAAEWEPES